MTEELAEILSTSAMQLQYERTAGVDTRTRSLLDLPKPQLHVQHRRRQKATDKAGQQRNHPRENHRERR